MLPLPALCFLILLLIVLQDSSLLFQRVCCFTFPFLSDLLHFPPSF